MIDIILFPSEPFSLSAVDPDFSGQMEAAEAIGFEVTLVDTEEMRIRGSLREQTVLYRGWMLSPEKYEELSFAVHQKGGKLLISPEQYLTCHYLPGWYETLREHTPDSLTLNPKDELGSVGEYFGDKAIIVKDYVKSAKHYWHEACYIPRASDAEKRQKVVSRFLELRGDFLEGGLVFREFVPLVQIGEHPKSGLPLTLEYRLFFFRHRLIHCDCYWEDQFYNADTPRPPVESFERLAQNVKSSFFTMDVACDQKGEWWVMELGDGQVSGLPESLSPSDFYRALKM